MGLFGRKKAAEQVAEAQVQHAENKVDFKTKMKAIREVGRFSIEQKDKLQKEETTTINGIETINWIRQKSYKNCEFYYGYIKD